MKFCQKIILIVLLFISALSVSACGKPPVRRSIAETDNRVASVTICASSGNGEKVFGLFNFGHAFICLTNETEGNIDILGFILPAHKTATISTWSLTKKFGVWFNVESAFIEQRNKYADRLSVTAGVSETALQGLNEYLRSHNSWSVFQNCTAFSIGLFNTLVTEENKISVSGIVTPEKLKNEIRRFDTFEVMNKIDTEEVIGYLGDDGFVGGFSME